MASSLHCLTASSRGLLRCCARPVPPKAAARRRFVCSAMAAPAEVEQALAVINRQLECYNAQDLEPFMDLMADDVHVSDGETGAVLATSKEQLRPRYVERFKTPVHAELLGRVCLGSTVVDREIITGLPDGGEADCMATYVVKDGKISKIQFVWRPRTAGTRMH